jgi:hypothetical protein
MKKKVIKWSVILSLLASTTNPFLFAQQSQQVSRLPHKEGIVESQENLKLLSGTRMRQNPPATPSGTPRASVLDCSVCELPEKAFIIDASTGETYWRDVSNPQSDKSRTRFRSSEKIDVVVINKNPFLFTYEIGSIPTSLAGDGAIISFLKVFSTLFSTFPTPAEGTGTPETSTPQTQKVDAVKADKSKNLQCSDLRGTILYEKTMNDILQLLEDQKTVNSEWQTLQGKYDKLKTAYQRALENFAKRRVQCCDLCETAKNFFNEIENVESGMRATFKNVKAGFDRLKIKADTLNTAINDFVAGYPLCQTMAEVLRTHQPKVLEISSAAVRDLSILEEMLNSYNKILEVKQALNSLAARPYAFQDKITLGPFAAPTDVAVTLKYKSVDAAATESFKDAVNVKLNFGGEARFVVSGGIVYGLLDRPEYKAVLGLERDRQGNIIANQAPASVIGLTEKVNKRLTPILMLNTRVFELSRSSDLFFSFGITSSFTETSKIEYLFGPSVNFFDRRVFVTYGLYGGKVQRLNPGLFVGLTVDAGLAETKLVRNDFVWKSGFAVTYKIR